jgi:S-layer protein (TIGR01567 family)
MSVLLATVSIQSSLVDAALESFLLVFGNRYRIFCPYLHDIFMGCPVHGMDAGYDCPHKEVVNMKKRTILLIALVAMTMVGFASAAETVDKLEMRDTIVDTAAGISPIAATWAAGELHACTWDAYNFAAFWYDLDNDLATETLTIDTAANVGGHGPLSTYQRVIDEDELIYQTVPVGQAFVACRELATTSPGLRVKGAEPETVLDEDGDGISNEPETCYNVVGWMAEKYIGVNGRVDILAKLLVEFEATDKKTLATGESWDMGGGFSLTAVQIDLEGNKVWLRLNKSGTEIDSEVIGRQNPTEQDMLYVVTMDDVGGEDDVPIFVAYVDAIFNETNTIQLKYVWLMSDEAIEINDGDEFDALKVTMADSNMVELKNDNSIALWEDGVIDVCGDVKFKVADDAATIRFYPFVERTIGGVAPTLPPATIPATDTDGDGVPDVWDADNSTPAGYWVNPQGIGRMWGDMNGDGWLTSVDALMILQAAAGKIGL